MVNAYNKAYYNKGYAEGYAQSINSVAISYTYHKHTNGNGDIVTKATVYSSAAPGGCYIAAGHKHNAITTCSTTTTKTKKTHTHSMHAGTCPHCGHVTHEGDTDSNGYANHSCTYTSTTTSYTCGSPTNTWKLGCGKTESTIESATIIFN